jgi:hypothetical protein
VSLDSSLLATYGINMTTEYQDEGRTRIIRLAGEATAWSYEQVRG